MPLASLDRRRLLLLTGAGVAAIRLGGSAQAAGLVRWTSPRGTIEVLDDYPYWVAQRFGYFGDLSTTLDAGAMRAEATVDALGSLEADMGCPSPALLARSLERGLPLTSVWNECATDLFGFAFRPGGKLAGLAGLKGKTVVLGSLAWQPIVDLTLAQAGLMPGSVTYAEAGAQWAQAFLRGQGDAALTWEGMRAQWQGQGYAFDYLTPREFSQLPGNSFVIRTADLNDPARQPLFEQYLRGWAMGLAFAHQNPRAATQITAEQFPVLRTTLTPDQAVASLLQLARAYRGAWERRQGWGWHDLGQWQSAFDLMQRLGQTRRRIMAETACSNAYVAAANGFDAARVAADARLFQLAREFQGTEAGPGAASP